MKKTVAELFAGIGGFRVGLNDVQSIDKFGKAVEKGDWEFVWMNQYEPSTKKQDVSQGYILFLSFHKLEGKLLSTYYWLIREPYTSR